MTRVPFSILTAWLMIASLHPADAATRKVRIPNHYDGAWTIVATTASGPCKASTSYQVRIKDGDASTPNQAVDIDGGVSVEGAVRATIIKASNRAPITGSLDARGSGNGTWRTSGALVECTGSWSAKRGG